MHGKNSTAEKISIIIPVYQVEAYLPRCLDSVIRQTYQDLEIILVDDGSRDRSPQICDIYAKKDPRIRVIHKENAGVANARNDGLAAATGAYISFIDSDDWIARDAYEILHDNLIKYGADCVVGGCVNVIEKGHRYARQRTGKRSGGVECKTSTQGMERVLLRGSAIWNRLFRREVFTSIRFPSGRINDDEVVALHAYAVCSKIVFLDQETYFYRIRENSITTAAFSMKKMDIYYNSIENLEFVRQNRPELTECAEYKYYKAMLYCYIQIKRSRFGKNADPAFIPYEKELKENIRMGRARAMENAYLPRLYKMLMRLCCLASGRPLSK